MISVSEGWMFNRYFKRLTYIAALARFARFIAVFRVFSATFPALALGFVHRAAARDIRLASIAAFARFMRFRSVFRVSGATAAALLLGFVHPAAAQDIGTVATNVAGSANPISNLAIAVAGLGGIVLFIMGGKDLVTATTSSGRDAKHVHGFVKMGVAALLFSVGVGLNVMKTTAFEGNTNSSITPNTISVNNGTP
jgi:hypothetical protein